jgi:hypothetical protein
MPGIRIKTQWDSLARATDTSNPANADQAFAMHNMSIPSDAAKIDKTMYTSKPAQDRVSGSPETPLEVVSIPTKTVLLPLDPDVYPVSENHKPVAWRPRNVGSDSGS